MFSLVLSLLLPFFSTGNPYQVLSPLSVSSIIKEPILFFLLFNVFCNDVSYITHQDVFVHSL